MVKLNASYDFMDAIEDIKVISKDKKLGITKDILPHLAIELVKSEQERKRNEILEEGVRINQADTMLDIPLTDISHSLSEIATAIERTGEVVLPKCPNCYSVIDTGNKVCPECSFNLKVGEKRHV